ncbi:MAG: efflux transporter outer membrane subunit [Candidatus Electrothrix aestuarii]|uniref:Efflux transporter outer membrane subunit n=1 Tax=Candidatus Electrothrix aestuarii TaxID=3062594 RepID=A0AAU8LWG5_9BACT
MIMQHTALPGKHYFRTSLSTPSAAVFSCKNHPPYSRQVAVGVEFLINTNNLGSAAMIIHTIQRKNRRLAPLLCCGLMLQLLTACAVVGPEYQKPDLHPAAQWNSPLLKGLQAEQADPQQMAAWWELLEDEQLSSLIERAVQGNLDLRTAAERVEQARLQRDIQTTGRLPSVDAGGAASWRRNGNDGSSESYSSSLDAGWEADLFGSVQRSIEAADADWQASQEERRDVLVSLVAEVALNYIEVRSTQVQLANVRKSLAMQRETRQLVQWQYEAGLDDDLAIHQAQYNLESSEAQIPALETSLAEAMNRLAVLLGQSPGSLHTELKEARAIPAIPATVAIGVPAEVIRRRPDIRKAENQLIAQTARIGVATAELYPKLRLSGVIGINGSSVARFAENIFSPAFWVQQAGLSASWNIFDAGAIRKNIQVRSSQQKEALIAYEAAVLRAMEEVENTLIAYVNEQGRRDSLERAVKEAEQATELAEKKYKAGLIDFSTVLETQRTLLSFDKQLTGSEATMAANLIRLYKALGGGWPCCPEDTANATSSEEIDQ